VTAAINGPIEQAYSSIDSSRPSLNAGNVQAGNDTFAALDADQALPSTAWTHGGTRHAEAGYLDPVLGWVGVRADATHNGIHAAVVPGSLEAAEVLGGHLSGLNAHLALHHGNAATVTLASPQDGPEGMGWNAQTRAGDRDAAGHDADGGRATHNTAAKSLRTQQTSPIHPDFAATTINRLVPGISGSYISVMA
jgi:hypothetical protein